MKKIKVHYLDGETQTFYALNSEQSFAQLESMVRSTDIEGIEYFNGETLIYRRNMPKQQVLFPKRGSMIINGFIVVLIWIAAVASVIYLIHAFNG